MYLQTPQGAVYIPQFQNQMALGQLVPQYQTPQQMIMPHQPVMVHPSQMFLPMQMQPTYVVMGGQGGATMAPMMALQQGSQQVVQLVDSPVPEEPSAHGDGSTARSAAPLIPQKDVPNDRSTSSAAETDASQGNTHRSVVLRASRQTPLEGIAGAIAKRARSGYPIILEGIGPAPVAQVMRALVHATLFLRDRLIQLSARCQFVRPSSSSRLSLAFTVEATLPSEDTLPSGDPITVHGKNVAERVASVIVGIVCCPEDGILRKTRLCCRPSALAINSAAKAVALARVMLKETDHDLKMKPLLTKTAPSCEETTDLVFELIPCALEEH